MTIVYNNKIYFICASLNSFLIEKAVGLWLCDCLMQSFQSGVAWFLTPVTLAAHQTNSSDLFDTRRGKMMKSGDTVSWPARISWLKLHNPMKVLTFRKQNACLDYVLAVQQ